MASEDFRVALAGNPNCGKTALFNALTGSRQKVGNYPGVTVERVEGSARMLSGLSLKILDLPGTYSLDAQTPDELITQEVLLGLRKEEPRPAAVIAVADATNLERTLGLVLEIQALGVPLIVALNMMDLAQKRGSVIDLDALATKLGVPVVPTIATQSKGLDVLLQKLEELRLRKESSAAEVAHPEWKRASPQDIHQRFSNIDEILRATIKKAPAPTLWTDRIDRIVLHPIWGTLLLAGVLALLFQTIFTWATIPMVWIENGIGAFSDLLRIQMAEGPLRSLLVDGMIGGVGSILVFLPQILLLFLFLLILEDSGYMARAAFLMDRLMGKVGLHGRAFIPLLSSFACAVPGIMATRTIENRRDRLITILVSPLITCSARLPVYSLLIAAFVPNQAVWGPVRLQGVVMFLLYLSGIIAALLVAIFLKKSIFQGPIPALMLELPTYKWPSPHNVLHGLVERASVFIRRAGTVILGISIVLWFLASYPKPPEQPPAHNFSAAQPAITYSYAGQLGQILEPLVRPIGFNWQIAISLIPGFAAREMMIGALGTVYALEDKDAGAHRVLASKIGQEWSLATGMSLLVWYILSCQCASTLAVTRRETNSWKWPGLMFAYMTILAYLASFVVYNLLTHLGYG